MDGEIRHQPAAHSACGSAGTRWHALDDHLAETARRAADHAAGFGGRKWAALAGLWHDLGKYRPGFQRYLRAATGAEAESAHIEGGAGRVSHSTAGALLACERFGTAGRVLAYLIASHHAGLYDWHSDTLVTANLKIDDHDRAGHVGVAVAKSDEEKIMTRKYGIQLEIAGPTAMWTRPDTGDSPGTYPVPTRSAAKGIFEAILWNPAVEIVPVRVEICAPLLYHHYATNYGGPLRKSGQIKDGNNYQLFATVLINVHYRLFAELYPASNTDFPPKVRQWLERTRSSCHAFKDIFERRLRRGQCHYVPSLGWREFVPSYVGEARDTPTQTDINLNLPSIPDQIFHKSAYGDHALTYSQGLVIEAGVLRYGAHHAE